MLPHTWHNNCFLSSNSGSRGAGIARLRTRQPVELDRVRQWQGRLFARFVEAAMSPARLGASARGSCRQPSSAIAGSGANRSTCPSPPCWSLPWSATSPRTGRCWSPARARPGPAGAALWLSAEGGLLSETTLAFHVTALTGAAFGRPVNAHLFRDAAATSRGDRGPGARARRRPGAGARRVLHHRAALQPRPRPGGGRELARDPRRAATGEKDQRMQLDTKL